MIVAGERFGLTECVCLRFARCIASIYMVFALPNDVKRTKWNWKAVTFERVRSGKIPRGVPANVRVIMSEQAEGEFIFYVSLNSRLLGWEHRYLTEDGCRESYIYLTPSQD